MWSALESFTDVIGWLVVALLVVYGVLYALYRVLNIKARPTVSAESMPSLKPVPIPTKNQKSSLHKLVVFIFEVRRWELTQNWYFDHDNGVKIVIPKGFRFDGASIPKIFWAVLSPVGLLLIPGLLHDYGYRYNQLWKIGPDGSAEPYRKGAGKDFWDQLFRDVGKRINGMHLINFIAWLATKAGGRASWDKHRSTSRTVEAPEI